MLGAGGRATTEQRVHRSQPGGLMEQSDFVHTGQKVGLVMASVVTPSTLAPSLSKRSWQDQGLITGLSTGASYLLTLFSQDVIDVVTPAVAGAAATWSLFPGDWPEARRRSVAALGCELTMTPLGLGLAAYLDRRGAAQGRGAHTPGGLADGLHGPVRH